MAPGVNEPYFDPVHHLFDALERSMASPQSANGGFYPDADVFLDDVGWLASQLEAGIEDSTVPPFTPEPWQPPAPLREATLSAWTGDGSPPPIDQAERRWDGGLMPPVAARPSFASEGLTSPPVLSHGHGSTGISCSGDQGTIRWCPEAEDFVDEEACQDCEHWGDHGNGIPECYYDWLEGSHGEDCRDGEGQ